MKKGTFRTTEELDKAIWIDETVAFHIWAENPDQEKIIQLTETSLGVEFYELREAEDVDIYPTYYITKEDMERMSKTQKIMLGVIEDAFMYMNEYSY